MPRFKLVATTLLATTALCQPVGLRDAHAGDGRSMLAPAPTGLAQDPTRASPSELAANPGALESGTAPAIAAATVTPPVGLGPVGSGKGSPSARPQPTAPDPCVLPPVQQAQAAPGQRPAPRLVWPDGDEPIPRAEAPAGATGGRSRPVAPLLSIDSLLAESATGGRAAGPESAANAGVDTLASPLPLVRRPNQPPLTIGAAVEAPPAPLRAPLLPVVVGEMQPASEAASQAAGGAQPRAGSPAPVEADREPAARARSAAARADKPPTAAATRAVGAGPELEKPAPSRLQSAPLSDPPRRMRTTTVAERPGPVAGTWIMPSGEMRFRQESQDPLVSGVYVPGRGLLARDFGPRGEPVLSLANNRAPTRVMASAEPPRQDQRRHQAGAPALPPARPLLAAARPPLPAASSPSRAARRQPVGSPATVRVADSEAPPPVVADAAPLGPPISLRKPPLKPAKAVTAPAEAPGQAGAAPEAQPDRTLVPTAAIAVASVIAAIIPSAAASVPGRGTDADAVPRSLAPPADPHPGSRPDAGREPQPGPASPPPAARLSESGIGVAAPASQGRAPAAADDTVAPARDGRREFVEFQAKSAAIQRDAVKAVKEALESDAGLVAILTGYANDGLPAAKRDMLASFRAVEVRQHILAEGRINPSRVKISRPAAGADGVAVLVIRS